MKHQEIVLRMALMYLLGWCHDACLTCSLNHAFARVKELHIESQRFSPRTSEAALVWLQAYQAFDSSTSR